MSEFIGSRCFLCRPPIYIGKVEEYTSEVEEGGLSLEGAQEGEGSVAQ